MTQNEKILYLNNDFNLIKIQILSPQIIYIFYGYIKRLFTLKYLLNPKIIWNNKIENIEYSNKFIF